MSDTIHPWLILHVVKKNKIHNILCRFEHIFCLPHCLSLSLSLLSISFLVYLPLFLFISCAFSLAVEKRYPRQRQIQVEALNSTSSASKKKKYLEKTVKMCVQKNTLYLVDLNVSRWWTNTQWPLCLSSPYTHHTWTGALTDSFTCTLTRSVTLSLSHRQTWYMKFISFILHMLWCNPTFPCMLSTAASTISHIRWMATCFFLVLKHK